MTQRMKRNGFIACAFIIGTMLTLGSCIDDKFLDFSYDPNSVQLELMLSLPGESLAATRAVSTRVEGENKIYNGLDYNTAPQYYIGTNDVYALVYKVEDTDTTLYAVPSMTLKGENGDEERTASGNIDRPSEDITITVDVIANLVQNGYASSAAVARTQLQQLIGQTREDVNEAIGTFTYPTYEDNDYAGWALEVKDESGNTTSTRYLPMWGKGSTTQKITSNSDIVDLGTCNMYRSVAKMGVMVSTEDFELKEVYIYYLNNEGKYVSSLYPNSSLNVQYTYPDVPTTSQRTKQEPLIYRLDDYNVTWNAFLNQIYVTETDNKEGSQPLVMVVGGYYKGGEYDGEGLVDRNSTDDPYTLNYYRIDMVDNGADNNPSGGSGPFDIIRNHSYIFNITACDNPGTSDPNPDYAAAGLTVEVLDYVDMPMHGVNAQYTLTVNQSLFSFSGATTAVGNLIVNTDGTGWELVTEWDTSDGYPEGGSLPDWVVLTEQEGGHTNVNDTVYIAVDANVNNEDMRSCSFWIKCGRVRKEIHLVQDYEETANGYLVTSAGTYDLKVNIRGNGNTQAWTTANEGGVKEDIDFGMTDSIANVAYVDIIWETADDFVTIPDPYDISQSGSISYVVNNVDLAPFGDWTGKVFDKGNGANALIGVFAEDGTLLWSYHIWGVGDFVDGVPMETWKVGSSASDLNEYEFMDRNLGAYSNLPGSKSFGLLYQWGRKDPFIGAYRELSVNGNDSTYERDYRQVRKQYTKHYQTINNQTYLWSEYNDEGDASTAELEKNLVQYTIEHPTTILEDGLLSADHLNDQAEGLWGTTDKSYVNSEAGNKTMYDPCPPGYRMPSLNALTIWDGTNDMWGSHSYLSSRFVPVPHGSDYSTTSGHNADFVSDAPFYGFWLDYANEYGFNSSGVYGVNYYDWDHPASDMCGWVTGYEGQSPEGLTWIPLAGVYNGTINNFGRAGLTDVMGGGRDSGGGGGGPDGGEGPGTGGDTGPGTGGDTGGGTGGDTGGGTGGGTTPGGEGGGGGGGNTPGPNVRRRAPQASKGNGDGYLPASSLHVTSVLWANSPNETNGSYPAGLLIHGTEGAYAPHYTSGGTATPYYYAPGVATNGTGTSTSAEDPIATVGPGYWITSNLGYGTEACGWWTGSIDADNGLTMDSSIANGTWNTTSGNDGIKDYSNWSDENGLAASGRHFHSYTETDPSTYAGPAYAASVRCIRDKDALTYVSDKIFDSEGNSYDDSTLLLYQYNYEGDNALADYIEMIVSYIEEWEVVSPGAKWVSVSPTAGSSQNLSGDYSVITITYLEDYLPDTTATATITIKFARGGTATITVQYVGGTRGSN